MPIDRHDYDFLQVDDLCIPFRSIVSWQARPSKQDILVVTTAMSHIFPDPNGELFAHLVDTFTRMAQTEARGGYGDAPPPPPPPPTDLDALRGQLAGTITRVYHRGKVTEALVRALESLGPAGQLRDLIVMVEGLGKRLEQAKDLERKVEDLERLVSTKDEAMGEYGRLLSTRNEEIGILTAERDAAREDRDKGREERAALTKALIETQATLEMRQHQLVRMTSRLNTVLSRISEWPTELLGKTDTYRRQWVKDRYAEIVTDKVT